MKHHVSGIAGLATIAMVGGAVLLLQAIVAVATSTPDSFTGTTSGYFSDGLSAAGLVLTIAGLIALRLVRATGDGRDGVTAIVLACVGQLGLVVSIVATLAAGREVLDAVYIVAFVVWFVGLVLVAITTATAHDLPRWSAVPLPLGALTATAFWAHGGSALLGAAWIALGLLLLRRTSTTRP